MRSSWIPCLIAANVVPLSNHLKVLQCIPNGLLLLRRALGLLGILRLGLIVALPLNDPALLLDLGDVQGSDVQAGLLLDVVFDGLLGGFAFYGGQVQFVYLEFDLDMLS